MGINIQVSCDIKECDNHLTLSYSSFKPFDDDLSRSAMNVLRANKWLSMNGFDEHEQRWICWDCASKHLKENFIEPQN